MSRAKRTRKARMLAKQAVRAERFEKRLDEAHAHLVEARERARLRIEINKTDLPEPAKFAIGSLIDPVGSIHDMIERQIRRGDTRG